MQVLCGLQVLFLLFNCQTPVYFFYEKDKIPGEEWKLDTKT